MSSVFADENVLVQLSPNLDSDTTADSCLKPANEIAQVSVALFPSPGNVLRSKSPLLVPGDECQTDESHIRGSEDEVSITMLSVDEDQSKSDATVDETAEQRQQRECDESESLAWEMMREESMTAYRMQMDFMSSSSNEMSAEDREAVQLAMGGYDNGTSNEEVDDEVVEEGEEEEDENQDSDVSQWDYDRLLALGEIIGDVKTERWRLKAKAVIKKLPQIKYAEMQLRQTQSDSSCSSSDNIPNTTLGVSHQQKKVRYDPSCAVCMEIFVKEDMLHVLPCQHYFHVECTKGWVADHNCCPMCKSAISFTP